MDTLNGRRFMKRDPLNNAAQAVSVVDFVLHDDNNTWDNNGGANDHIPIQQPVAVGEKARFTIVLWPNPTTCESHLMNPDGQDPKYLLEFVSSTGEKLSKQYVNGGQTMLATAQLPAGI